jgi:hypothetical protein
MLPEESQHELHEKRIQYMVVGCGHAGKNLPWGTVLDDMHETGQFITMKRPEKPGQSQA